MEANDNQEWMYVTPGSWVNCAPGGWRKLGCHLSTHVISTWLHDNLGGGHAHGLCKWLYYVSLRTINTNQPNHKSAVSVFIWLFNLDDGDKDE